MNCKHCLKDFENKRNTAKYCSNKCRVYSNRRVTVTNSVTVSVTKRNNSVTVKDELQEMIDKIETKPQEVSKPIIRGVYQEPQSYDWETGYKEKVIELWP